jgi:hypothetical protein
MEVGERGKDGGGMSKQRKSNPATLRMDSDWLARQMSAVATMMWTVAERMEESAVFDKKLKDRALVLATHGAMLSMWADEVRAQTKANKIGPMA